MSANIDPARSLVGGAPRIAAFGDAGKYFVSCAEYENVDSSEVGILSLLELKTSSRLQASGT